MPDTLSDVAISSSPWLTLVERSIQAWPEIHFTDERRPGTNFRLPTSFLRRYSTVDQFFDKSPSSLMFWFFQRRDVFLTQNIFQKWSRDRLDDYILIPASNGFISRKHCFFASHYWRHQDHPDPDGEYLRLFQDCLRQQEWLYIFVDWTCVPQSPRSELELKYFVRSLETMSAIIRNSGFVWFYPPFEPRLWILYEVAEAMLTCEGFDWHMEDMQKVATHVQELVRDGVQTVLTRHAYVCKRDSDRAFLISWLEVMVLIIRLKFDIGTIRFILDHLTWSTKAQKLCIFFKGGALDIVKFDGKMFYQGKEYNFTAFPTWGSYRPVAYSPTSRSSGRVNVKDNRLHESPSTPP